MRFFGRNNAESKQYGALSSSRSINSSFREPKNNNEETTPQAESLPPRGDNAKKDQEDKKGINRSRSMELPSEKSRRTLLRGSSSRRALVRGVSRSKSFDQEYPSKNLEETNTKKNLPSKQNKASISPPTKEPRKEGVGRSKSFDQASTSGPLSSSDHHRTHTANAPRPRRVQHRASVGPGSEVNQTRSKNLAGEDTMPTRSSPKAAFARSQSQRSFQRGLLAEDSSSKSKSTRSFPKASLERSESSRSLKSTRTSTNTILERSHSHSHHMVDQEPGAEEELDAAAASAIPAYAHTQTGRLGKKKFLHHEKSNEEKSRNSTSSNANRGTSKISSDHQDGDRDNKKTHKHHHHHHSHHHHHHHHRGSNQVLALDIPVA